MPESLVASTITLASCSRTMSSTSGRSSDREFTSGLPARPSYAARPSARISEFEESMLGGTGDACCTVSTVHRMAFFWVSRS